MNLQERQKELLKGTILSPHPEGPVASLSGGPNRPAVNYSLSWKILIYDTLCEDMVAPIFSVGELKRLGVTLYLRFQSLRQRVPDVPALYLISPTLASIDRLQSDFYARLYDEVHLAFTHIPDWFLPALATALAPTQHAGAIKTVVNLQMCHISLDKTLLTFAIPSASFAVSPRAGRAVVEATMNRSIAALLGVCRDLGQVPYLRCGPRGSLSFKIASALAGELFRSQHLFEGETPSRFAGSQRVRPRPRPLLMLFERSTDPVFPLRHSLAYLPLISDVFSLTNNKVTIKPLPSTPISASASSASALSSVSFELSSSDEFLQENKFRSFPDVAEDIDRALSEYAKEAGTVSQYQARAQAVLDLSASSSQNQNRTNATLPPISVAELQTAMDRLPDLAKRKKALDAHTNIGLELVNAVKSTSLNEFVELEDRLFVGTPPPAADIIALLASPPLVSQATEGNSFITRERMEHDRLRLLLIYYACALHPLIFPEPRAGESRNAFNAAKTSWEQAKQAFYSILEDSNATTTSTTTDTKTISSANVADDKVDDDDFGAMLMGGKVASHKPEPKLESKAESKSLPQSQPLSGTNKTSTNSRVEVYRGWVEEFVKLLRTSGPNAFPYRPAASVVERLGLDTGLESLGLGSTFGANLSSWISSGVTTVASSGFAGGEVSSDGAESAVAQYANAFMTTLASNTSSHSRSAISTQGSSTSSSVSALLTLDDYKFAPRETLAEAILPFVLDPKLDPMRGGITQAQQTQQVPQLALSTPSQFDEGVVVMLGSGCYNEYLAVTTQATSQARRNPKQRTTLSGSGGGLGVSSGAAAGAYSLAYCALDLCSPEGFLQEAVRMRTASTIDATEIKTKVEDVVETWLSPAQSHTRTQAHSPGMGHAQPGTLNLKAV